MSAFGLYFRRRRLLSSAREAHLNTHSDSMIRRTIFLICLAAVPCTGTASEEDFIPWQSLTARSVEIPVAGVVSVEATVSGNTYQKFTIGAFGRSRSLSADELKRLEGFPLSSLAITHEAGYVRLGGHTVHLRLQRTYYDPAQKLIVDILLISLPKDAELQISETRSIRP